MTKPQKQLVKELAKRLDDECVDLLNRIKEQYNFGKYRYVAENLKDAE